jgi:hypothetical protein
MKQTAIDWLIEQWPILESQLPPRIIEQAKAMEKKQIIESYRDGRSDQQSQKESRFYNRMAEQYYNETFNK